MEFRTLKLSAHCNINLVFKNGDQTIDIQQLRDAYDFIAIQYHGNFGATMNMYMENIGYYHCDALCPIDIYYYINNKFKKDIFLYLPWPMVSSGCKYINDFKNMYPITKTCQKSLLDNNCPCFIFTYDIDIGKLGYKITKVGNLGLIYHIDRIGKLTKAAIKN